jgi:hypothetical protein
MFNSTIFDLAFGLVCVFLAVSLLTSALTEALSTALGLRANTLLTGIKQLLNDEDLTGMAHALYNHALFNPLSNGQTKSGALPSVKPSYAQPRQFALALIDTIHAAAGEDASLLDAINTVSDPQIKATLLALHKRANGEISTFTTLLAGWFDNAMSRLSGVYKRRIKLISFFIALAVAVLLNADPIHLADTLWERQPVAAQLARFPVPTALDKNDPGKEGLDLVTEIESVGPLLGWTGFQKDKRWIQTPKFVLMLLGWVIAAGAALFGAPFWFDVLQRFVQLRGTGRPPSESASAAIPAALSAGSSLTSACGVRRSNATGPIRNRPRQKRIADVGELGLFVFALRRSRASGSVVEAWVSLLRKRGFHPTFNFFFGPAIV